MASTQSTDSDRERSARYRRAYVKESVYGAAVELLLECVSPPGVILDLGCGYAAVAEPLTDRGFEYVGVDREPAAVADVTRRGFEAHRADIEHPGAVDAAVQAATRRGQLCAVLLLDVLEHLPDTERFLADLGVALQGTDARLVLSVPNVAHYDVGAKLLTGRWDVTETGLLDRTHLQQFTARRLRDVMTTAGWGEVGCRDYELVISDQHAPADWPPLVRDAPLGEHLRRVRTAVDDTGYVNQLVRAFGRVLPAVLPLAEPQAAETVVARTVTVIVRTTGAREENLREVLTCLAAQRCDDFEVLLAVHSSEREVWAAVVQIVEEYEARFAKRVTVLGVVGGGRSRPLNVALPAARGAYCAFLDDDDLVTAGWVAAVVEGARVAPGRVIRSVTVDRRVRRPQRDELRTPAVALGGIEANHAPRFDQVEHLIDNGTPVCGFALPSSVIRTFRLRFDEELPVLEDWDMLLRAAEIAGVYDTEVPSSIYHRWDGAESSLGSMPDVIWRGARERVIARLDGVPTLLAPGGIVRVRQLAFELQQTTERLDATGRERDRLWHELDRQRRELERARLDAEQQWLAMLGVLHSRSWRVTAPLRCVMRALRAASGR